MLDVLEATQLTPLVSGFRRGLDEPLGILGLSLDDTERKRVAITRGFLRPTPILVLDELADALDSRQVSASLLKALEHRPNTRAIFAISSRPATVAWADRILVLDGGTIVAQGTHATLLATNEFYSTLYWETLLWRKA